MYIEGGEEIKKAKIVEETMGRSNATILTRCATTQTNVLRRKITKEKEELTLSKSMMIMKVLEIVLVKKGLLSL